MEIAVGLLLSAIIVFLFYQSKQTAAKWPASNYLLELEGKNFFCYNNKKDVQDAIEIILIPLLASNFEIIFLNGKNPESDYEEWLIKHILYNFKHYSKFPHLFKVRNGEIIELSINNEFYNTIDQNKPMSALINIIDAFFAL
ncbi:MAG: hypothetical protein ABIN91_20140 [Mucilaginibacter sp.]|uniref:hypothetical protein n=1 Tax=Mucilaginibacter sp. TaxID=1882438 RepID=UPI003263DBE9